MRSTRRPWTPLFTAWRGIVILPLMCVAGCREGESARTPPTSRNEVSEADFFVVPLSTPLYNTEPSIALHSVWRRGGVSDPEQLQFGRIVDADFDRAGTTYALDAATHRIRVFGADGQVTHVFGRAGSGPGETLEPRALIYDNAGSVLVADHRNGIVEFLFADNGYVTPSTTIPLEFRPTDLCLWNDDILVYGLHGNRILHLIDRQGNTLASFGDPFGPEDHAVQGIISLEGRLACFPEHNVVITVARLLPELRSYSVSDGQLLWTTSLPHFNQVSIELEPIGLPSGAYRMSQPAGGADQNVALSPISDQLVLLQSIRIPAAQEGGLVSTCLIRVSTGVCVLFYSDLPLLTATSHEYAIAVHGGRYPEVEFVLVQDLLASGSNASWLQSNDAISGTPSIGRNDE